MQRFFGILYSRILVNCAVSLIQTFLPGRDGLDLAFFQTDLRDLTKFDSLGSSSLAEAAAKDILISSEWLSPSNTSFRALGASQQGMAADSSCCSVTR